MPAREMFFTFDTKTKVNKKNVLQFVTIYKPFIEENFGEIKRVFDVDEINTLFLKRFIDTMKNFDSVSSLDGESFSDAQKIVKNLLVYLIAEVEPKEPVTMFGLKYLYDTWEHEGCGYDNYTYYTYINEAKLIKKFTKDANNAVSKLRDIGIEVEFNII